ncbi:hypothetical protein B0H12DRAFT_1100467 [Mycena haematopus]|nr:hypothetical protein B0H12DRAFT_1100467 [Mycena haematopus]
MAHEPLYFAGLPGALSAFRKCSTFSGLVVCHACHDPHSLGFSALSTDASYCTCGTHTRLWTLYFFRVFLHFSSGTCVHCPDSVAETSSGPLTVFAIDHG